MSPEPLSAEEVATIRDEVAAEKDEPGLHGEWMRLQARWLATLDEARATPSGDRLTWNDTLDVERLARALDSVDKGIATRYPGATETSRQKAVKVAREYAALRSVSADSTADEP